MAWHENGLCRFILPLPSADQVRGHILRREPQAIKALQLPDWVSQLVEDVQAHLGRDLRDFKTVPVGVTWTDPFAAQIYAACRAIPPGAVLTYGELARQLGREGAARAVGAAMGRNPVPLIIPCHRVVAADGKSGGFSAPRGVKAKLELLECEGSVGHLRPDHLVQPELF